MAALLLVFKVLSVTHCAELVVILTHISSWQAQQNFWCGWKIDTDHSSFPFFSHIRALHEDQFWNDLMDSLLNLNYVKQILCKSRDKPRNIFQWSWHVDQHQVTRMAALKLRPIHYSLIPRPYRKSQQSKHYIFTFLKFKFKLFLKFWIIWEIKSHKSRVLHRHSDCGAVRGKAVIRAPSGH